MQSICSEQRSQLGARYDSAERLFDSQTLAIQGGAALHRLRFYCFYARAQNNRPAWNLPKPGCPPKTLVRRLGERPGATGGRLVRRVYPNG